jgi:hypothetical protein
MGALSWLRKHWRRIWSTNPRERLNKESLRLMNQTLGGG